VKEGEQVYWFRKLYLRVVHVKNTVLISFSFLFVILAGLLIYNLEPEKFETPFNGIWYVMTTVTTVGYGDFSPATVPGKLFGMFLFIFGVGLIGVVIGKVVESFTMFQKRREEGLLNYSGSNHVVIIGWSKKSEMAVKEILEYPDKLDIVIIDSLDRTPYTHEHVYYIKGDPTSDETLIQANISTARSAIIFADERIIDTSLIDGKSLLIVSTIERAASHVYTTVEIMLEKHIDNFAHVQVNDFILSHETISRLAVRSALSKAMNNIFSQLLSRRHGDDMYQVTVRPHWKTYGDAFHELLSQGATLIADRDNLGINRMLDQPLAKESALFVICDEPTFLRIRGDKQ
jgi:voltage-gated potassium channel